MSGPKSTPLKRFGFKRTNTSGEPVPHTTETELSDLDAPGPSFSNLAAEFAGDGKHGHVESIPEISEVEANRRLSAFRSDHYFDPNMPDAAFEAVNDVTRDHDQKGEAKLVGELIEDSPYPEVCLHSRDDACNAPL